MPRLAVPALLVALFLVTGALRTPGLGSPGDVGRERLPAPVLAAGAIRAATFESADFAFALAEGAPPGESGSLVEAGRSVAPSAADLRESGSFQLAVPFRTQKDGDRFQGSNCGPASLAMVLRGFGMDESNADLRLISHTYQGTVGYRGGTALQYVAMAARNFGVDPVGLYEQPGSPASPLGSGGFRRWSVDDVREEVAAGRPVVPLVKYRLLPGHEGSTIRFDHYIVIHGMDGDRFLYHDPSFASPKDGEARWIDAAQLSAAMRASIVPNQAVAFGPGQHSELGVASS